MEKLNPEIKLAEIDGQTEGKPPASKLFGAPEPSMTTPDANAVTTSASPGTFVNQGAAAIIENMRTRINELETALVRLGLIKSR